MATYKELKQKYIDHLMEMDLDKMSVVDLYTYAGILKTINEMELPNYAEAMAAVLAQIMPVCAKNESEVREIG